MNFVPDIQLRQGPAAPSLSLEELKNSILERHLQPEDRFEIVAILESMGWNDERAMSAFGVLDLFELSEQIWDLISSDVLFTSYSEREKISFFKFTFEMVRSFLRGLIFAIPMAISVASMLTLRFSLWSYENLTLDLATSIAIGTLLSFLTVGGFTQSIARRGFFYIVQGYYNMGRRITYRFIRIGFVTSVLVSVLLIAFNLIFEIFPYRMILVIVLYYFFLTAIWLSVTVMYILQRELLFTGLIILGIFIVYVIVQLTGIAYIIMAQIISLGIVAFLGNAIALSVFKYEERRAERGISPKLPRMSITLYSVLPYFGYGFLYFLFLFMDRLMAWSTNDSSSMPYVIWFRGDYELGLDFSLLMLMIPMGICEVIIVQLMRDITTSQKGYMARDIEEMNVRYVQMYATRFFFLLLLSAASSLLIYWLSDLLFAHLDASIGKVLFTMERTHFVYVWSLVSYALLSVSLMNSLILFSLSQPMYVIRAIWPSVLANVITGFLLTRWLDYKFAVIGLLIGCIVFMVLSTREVLKVFRHLDYYLYATS